MSKRHGPPDWKRMDEEWKTLVDSGYKLRACTEYHWQIKTEDDSFLINIYPTTRKWVLDTEPSANQYKDIREVIAALYELQNEE